MVMSYLKASERVHWAHLDRQIYFKGLVTQRNVI